MINSANTAQILFIAFLSSTELANLGFIPRLTNAFEIPNGNSLKTRRLMPIGIPEPFGYLREFVTREEINALEAHCEGDLLRLVLIAIAIHIAGARRPMAMQPPCVRFASIRPRQNRHQI